MSAATTSEPSATPASGARSSRRVKLVLALAVALLGAALLSPTVRARVQAQWFALGLSSRDPMARTNARLALLDLGRPAIDRVYARLVASEIEDEVANTTSTCVFVATSDVGSPDPQARNWCRFALDEPILFPKGDYPLPERGHFESCADGIVCPVAERIVRRDAHRYLVVAGELEQYKAWVVRVAVPLDDELAPEVLEAVRSRVRSSP